MKLRSQRHGTLALRGCLSTIKDQWESCQEVIVRVLERSARNLKREINVTPMIDILLVLPIIFMSISSKPVRWA